MAHFAPESLIPCLGHDSLRESGSSSGDDRVGEDVVLGSLKGQRVGESDEGVLGLN